MGTVPIGRESALSKRDKVVNTTGRTSWKIEDNPSVENRFPPLVAERRPDGRAMGGPLIPMSRTLSHRWCHRPTAAVRLESSLTRFHRCERRGLGLVVVETIVPEKTPNCVPLAVKILTFFWNKSSSSCSISLFS